MSEILENVSAKTEIAQTEPTVALLQVNASKVQKNVGAEGMDIVQKEPTAASHTPQMVTVYLLERIVLKEKKLMIFPKKKTKGFWDR